jgi:serine/threonine protein kinase
MDRDEHSDSTQPVAGDLIAGKYRLVRALCTGGMGVVWVARHEVLNIDVAVKLLRSHGSRTGTARLLQEARAAARVAHEGVVRILEFGETPRGAPFIAMELLDGETMRERMTRGGPMAPVDAVRMLLPVASALCALCDRGIIHRDLKPTNIVLSCSDDGRIQPKLLDFGVALVSGSTRLTDVGAVVGTPQYFAPEQIMGEVLDARVDVWAFAAILFEALAGKPPFAGKDTTSTLRAILQGPPAAVKDLGLNDPDLEAVLAHGLCKNRQERIPSMRAFGTALALWASSKGVSEDITGASLRAMWLSPAAAPVSPIMSLQPAPSNVAPVEPPTPAVTTRAPHGSRAAREAETHARESKPVSPRILVTGAAGEESKHTPPRVEVRQAARHEAFPTLQSALPLPTVPSRAGRAGELRSWAVAATVAALLLAVGIWSNWGRVTDDEEIPPFSPRPAEAPVAALPMKPRSPVAELAAPETTAARPSVTAAPRGPAKPRPSTVTPPAAAPPKPTPAVKPSSMRLDDLKNPFAR